ncbi:MAG: hypothetical protein NWE89_01630 [Candidatus Bathyarchaeota archaeon]|nr:hypothetical protein [Candidatus Bathyarchaeota archaeon]
MSIDDYQIVGLVFHDILSSYQVAIRDTLGNSDAAILNLVDHLCENVKMKGIEIDKHGFEDLIGILSMQVAKLGLGKISLSNIGNDNYLFRLDECVWAEISHKRKKQKDVTCPWALIAMALYQASTGNKVFVADSEYLPNGTITKIRPVSDIYNVLK